jgi:hypothetical protein
MKVLGWLVAFSLLQTPHWARDNSNPQLDPCFCADHGGVWYTLPDMCCWQPGRHELDPMDGIVDIRDFLHLIANWGPCPTLSCCGCDIDQDDECGVSDMLLIMESWGQHPKDFIRCRELP